MGRLRTAFHVLATSTPDPGALLEAMNAQVESIPDAFCTTIVCALIDPVRATMRWSRAGHLPPLLVGADGAELLDQAGMPPLGVIDDARAPVHNRMLRDDDLVVLYTDGIIERRDEAIDAGLDRLQAVATHLADLCPADFCDALIQALVPEQAQRDDIAALAVRLASCIDITADSARTGNGHTDRYRDHHAHQRTAEGAKKPTEGAV
jgi:serine phosphatase RsbU (regulator of sigma subunit)